MHKRITSITTAYSHFNSGSIFWTESGSLSLQFTYSFPLTSLLQFQMLHACYMYYLSKFTEFIDTVSKKCDKRLLYVTV